MSRLIKLQTIIMALVVSLATCGDSTINCHYSCKQCVGESYTLCSVCVEEKNITIVEDPTVSDPQYINSNIATGVCTGDVPPKANALGVLLVIICSAVAGVVRTPSSIYLISTLQTISLISFVEVAWVTPVGYLLQSLQYFMVFNWMGSGYKVQDQTMRQRQYYRLDLYMHESSFMKNIAIVGLADLAVAITIIALGIWKYRKDKKKKELAQLQICSEKSQKLELNSQQMSQTIYKEQPDLLQKTLEMVLKICLTAFFLLIQETSLVIMVSLRFQRPISMGAKAIPIIYCIFLLAFFVYTYFNKLWFFPNKQTQFLGIWRKIGLPVLTIVPYKITFLIVAFLLIFVILESFFDFKGGKQKLLSRITFFKLVELIVVILAGAYLVTELSRNIELQTNIIRVFLSISIIAFFVCFFIEIFFGVIQTYIANKNEVNNQNEGNQNVFHPENTLENIEPNAGENKIKNIMIYDIEDQVADDSPHNHNQLKNSLKITQVSNKQMNDPGKDKNNSKVSVDGNDKQKGNRSENTEETDKAAKEKEKQQALKRQQEEEEKARRKKEEQQLQAQRKRQLQLQSQRRKQEQLEAIRKKQEEESRKKKEKQQLQEKRRRELEQQQARRRKEQEEYEAEERAKRKRKYESQKDVELRKRYGM